MADHHVGWFNLVGDLRPPAPTSSSEPGERSASFVRASERL
jgi:hypothetical protein